jgi:hypothetical protein
MINYPCGESDCILCALHCPYCGQWPIVLHGEGKTGQARCPTCGQAEDLPHPKMIELRHRQVPALSGRTIPEWKAQGRQLGTEFHHRWRRTLDYLDPAASAALSFADDLMIHGYPEDQAINLAREAKRDLQDHINTHPGVVDIGRQDLVYPEDWF